MGRLLYHIGSHCAHCGVCMAQCRAGAIRLLDDGAYRIDPSLCTGCGRCCRMCRAHAIQPASGTSAPGDSHM